LCESWRKIDEKRNEMEKKRKEKKKIKGKEKYSLLCSPN
jgi:hypothetical protein